MPALSSEVLALLGGAATILAQLVKGLLPEKAKEYLPIILFLICVPLGAALAFYYGRDPVAGCLEGLFGFASAVGFYEAANAIPGAKTVFNDRGWIVRE